MDLRAQNQRARRAQARKKRVAKEYKPDQSGGGGPSGLDKRKESSAERYQDGQPSTSSAGGGHMSGSKRRIPPKDGESAPAVMQIDPASTDT